MKARTIISLTSVALTVLMLASCGSTEKTVKEESNMISDTVSVTESNSENKVSSETASKTEKPQNPAYEPVTSVNPGEDWRSHPGDYKLIAFTFDDAPNASTVTESNTCVRMIRTMNKYNGAGTLFVIGTRLENYGTELLKYALDRGFELGNHTYSHTDVTSADFKQFHPDYTAEQYLNDEVIKGKEVIEKNLNVPVKYIRASGAHTTDYVIEACETAGMPIIFGNQAEDGTSNSETAVADWNSATTPEHIKSAVLDYAYDGKIVVMHSTVKLSADVLDEICEKLYNDGYRFCTLSELFEYKLGITDTTKIDVKKSLSGTGSSRGLFDTGDVVLR